MWYRDARVKQDEQVKEICIKVSTDENRTTTYDSF